MNYKTAFEIAKKYHHGQTRRGGLPYITHPMADAAKFEDEDRKIVSILHDTIEDTELTTFDLSFTYRLSIKLVVAIDIITRGKDQPYLDYILECKANDIVRDVKVEDIKDNLSGQPHKNKIDVYKLALYILEN